MDVDFLLILIVGFLHTRQNAGLNNVSFLDLLEEIAAVSGTSQRPQRGRNRALLGHSEQESSAMRRQRPLWRGQRRVA